jgi:hypothetical protein
VARAGVAAPGFLGAHSPSPAFRDLDWWRAGGPLSRAALFFSCAPVPFAGELGVMMGTEVRGASNASQAGARLGQRRYAGE